MSGTDNREYRQYLAEMDRSVLKGEMIKIVQAGQAARTSDDAAKAATKMALLVEETNRRRKVTTTVRPHHGKLEVRK